MQPNIIDATDVVIGGLGRGINWVLAFLLGHPILVVAVAVVGVVAVVLYRIHKNTPHLAPASRADGGMEKWRL